MPPPYIEKLSKDKHIGKSKEKLEELWAKAKDIAAHSKQKNNFGYITGIFKKMIGKHSYKEEVKFSDYVKIINGK